MQANSKRNTLAIKSKTKDIQTKKLSTIKNKKINSKSIAKATKVDKLDNCESNTSAIDHKTKEPCKSIAKVLPKNNIVDLQITPQLKQNIINVAQAAPGLSETSGSAIILTIIIFIVAIVLFIFILPMLIFWSIPIITIILLARGINSESNRRNRRY